VAATETGWTTADAMDICFYFSLNKDTGKYMAGKYLAGNDGKRYGGKI
jgi:hypothetical protein